ncbi:MAG: DUF4386 domain-containing protein [Gammaproteobacteria bacterium]|nr:DUF4386 domain-containing protein [Gammaproteobacteria bacterium]
MTRTTNARIAGFTFLAYIVVTIASESVLGHAASGASAAAQLASMSEHVAGMYVVIFLALAQAFAAIILAVTLYAITREQNRDLAIFAMMCRVVEGVRNGFVASTYVALLWIAIATVPGTPATGALQVLGEFLLGTNGDTITGIFFAVGNALFAWLLLRGRVIPAALGWLGVASSIILLVGLPAELVTSLPIWAQWLMFLPALAYEIPLGFWLLIKGVGTSQPRGPGRNIPRQHPTNPDEGRSTAA